MGNIKTFYNEHLEKEAELALDYDYWEESMLIMVIGNMASGKSEVSRALCQKLYGFKHLDLDEYRKKFNKKRTQSGDDQAQKEFIKSISNTPDVIVECTGTGKWYHKYFSSNHKKCLIILLDSEVQLCRKRHKKRLKDGYELPPIPMTWSLRFDKSLIWMNRELKSAQADLVLKATGKVEANVKRILKKIREDIDG